MFDDSIKTVKFTHLIAHHHSNTLLIISFKITVKPNKNNKEKLFGNDNNVCRKTNTRKHTLLELEKKGNKTKQNKGNIIFHNKILREKTNTRKIVMQIERTIRRERNCYRKKTQEETMSNSI